MKRAALLVVMALACGSFAGCAALSKGSRDDQVAAPPSGPPALATDRLPNYEPVANLSGLVTSIGSSTTTNLIARASTPFRRIYPDVILRVSAGLTEIGPPALLEGRAEIVPMSRPLTREEIGSFVAKYGYPPTEIVIAADALAVYVEKRNPLSGLTLARLEGMFAAAPHGGSAVETWGQAGLTGEWADRPVNLYGYGPEDGVSQVFRQWVLGGGEYRLAMVVEPAGSSVVQGVAADPSGIGVASIFFASKRVRAVPLAGRSDGHFYNPSAANVQNRSYPLIRYLTVCVNKPPHRPLPRPAAEFLRFLLSREGQEVIAAEGAIPLDAHAAQQGRRAIHGSVTAGARGPQGSQGGTGPQGPSGARGPEGEIAMPTAGKRNSRDDFRGF